MAIEAVIFDMDGVLVDSEVYWFESRVDFARDLGKTWTHEDQRLAMGRNTVEWARVMRERLEITMPVEDIMADMKRRVIRRYEAQMPLRPGAIGAVEQAGSVFRVGLASGSPTDIIRRVMALTGLDKVFEVMVFGDDIPNGKPAPDIYLDALARLQIAPERAVGIEDSSNGVRSLFAAGMYAVAAPSPGFALPADVLALADCTIESLEDFSPALVRGLEAAPPRSRRSC